MFFVVYGKEKLFLVNLLNLNYEVWTDFSGIINSVVINDCGKYILVTTDYHECPLYIIYHSSLNFFNKNNYSVNDYDIEQNYLQLEYHFFHKIYNLSFSKDFIISKVQANMEQNRLFVLYTNKEKETVVNQSMLFQVDFNQDINNFSLEFLLPINNMNGLSVTDFERTFNYQREIESFIIVYN